MLMSNESKIWLQILSYSWLTKKHLHGMILCNSNVLSALFSSLCFNASGLLKPADLWNVGSPWKPKDLNESSLWSHTTPWSSGLPLTASDDVMCCREDGERWPGQRQKKVWDRRLYKCKCDHSRGQQWTTHDLFLEAEIAIRQRTPFCTKEVLNNLSWPVTTP